MDAYEYVGLAGTGGSWESGGDGGVMVDAMFGGVDVFVYSTMTSRGTDRRTQPDWTAVLRLPILRYSSAQRVVRSGPVSMICDQKPHGAIRGSDNTLPWCEVI